MKFYVLKSGTSPIIPTRASTGEADNSHWQAPRCPLCGDLLVVTASAPIRVELETWGSRWEFFGRSERPNSDFGRAKDLFRPQWSADSRIRQVSVVRVLDRHNQ